MGKVRKIKQNFTQVCNTWLKDTNLSAKAKGIICFLQSVDDGWDYSIKGLATQFNDGEESITSGIKELVKAGYITWERHRNANGQLEGNDVFLHERPIRENPKQVKDLASEISTNKIKNNKQNTDYNKNISTNVDISPTASETAVVKSYGNESINQAFNAWEQLFGYKLKQSQANRNAVWNMLRAKDKGEEWLTNMMALLKEAQKDKYSGIHIANFADLQRDWEKLMAWGATRYEQRADKEFEQLVSVL